MERELKIVREITQSKNQKFYYKTISPRNVRNYILKTHQYDCLNWAYQIQYQDTRQNRHGKVQMSQPYKENYRLQRNAESRRHSLLQGRVQQLIIQYQMVIPKTMPTSNIVQIKYVVLIEIYMYICICMCVCTATINERRAMIWRHKMEEKEGDMK